MPVLVVRGTERAAGRSFFNDVGEGRWELRLTLRTFEQRVNTVDMRIVVRQMRILMAHGYAKTHSAQRGSFDSATRRVVCNRVFDSAGPGAEARLDRIR